MNILEFVLAIVIVAMVGRTIQIWVTARASAHGQSRDLTTLAEKDEVRQLKERIQVLERVITDNNGSSNRLGDEIERLRDR